MWKVCKIVTNLEKSWPHGDILKLKFLTINCISKKLCKIVKHFEKSRQCGKILKLKFLTINPIWKELWKIDNHFKKSGKRGNILKSKFLMNNPDDVFLKDQNKRTRLNQRYWQLIQSLFFRNICIIVKYFEKLVCKRQENYKSSFQIIDVILNQTLIIRQLYRLQFIKKSMSAFSDWISIIHK